MGGWLKKVIFINAAAVFGVLCMPWATQAAVFAPVYSIAKEQPSPELQEPTRGSGFAESVNARASKRHLAAVQLYNGTVRPLHHISSRLGTFAGTISQYDDFATAVTFLGDLDADGNPDIAIGAFSDEDGGDDRGAVWILKLSATGTVKSHQKISDTQGGFTGALHNNAEFGCAVAGMPDLDGDGVPELAVGSRMDNDGGSNRGAVWILFLRAAGTVKSHQKISDTQGGFGGTLSLGDWFGSSVACLPDMDADGVPELAVGAIRDNFEGAVWILFLHAAGTVKSYQKIASATGGFTGTIGSLDVFGKSVSEAGDIDGDGVVDLAVGAPNDDTGGPNRGAVWLMFLNSAGTVRSHFKITSSNSGMSGQLQDIDEFGSSIAALADMDNDGRREIAVGGQGVDDIAQISGAVWILFLGESGGIRSLTRLSAASKGTASILGASSRFGNSLAAYFPPTVTAGTLPPVLLAGIPGEGSTVTEDNGHAWLLEIVAQPEYLSEAGTVLSDGKISDTQGNFTGTMRNQDWFGTSVTGLPDLDGNGQEDLAVGAPYYDVSSSNTGVVWVLLLQQTTSNVLSHVQIGAGQGGFTGTLQYNDWFGSAVGWVPGLRGPTGVGTGALAVGAPGDDGQSAGGDRHGAVWVLFLDPSGTVSSHVKIATGQGGFTPTLADVDIFGASLAGLPDVDGDGVPELLVGAPGDDLGGTNKGLAYLLFLRNDGTVASHAEFGNPGRSEVDQSFGYGLSAIEDLDGDGVPEISVGMPFYNAGGVNRGAAWVLRLHSDGRLKDWQIITEGTTNGPASLNDWDQFGVATTGLPDLDGDGVAELAIGAPEDDSEGNNRGAVWLGFLQASGSVLKRVIERLARPSGGFVGPLADNDWFGIDVAFMSGFGGHSTRGGVQTTADWSRPWLAVGAKYDSDGGHQRGAVHLLELQAIRPSPSPSATPTPGLSPSSTPTPSVSPSTAPLVEGNDEIMARAIFTAPDDAVFIRPRVWDGQILAGNDDNELVPTGKTFPLALIGAASLPALLSEQLSEGQLYSDIPTSLYGQESYAVLFNVGPITPDTARLTNDTGTVTSWTTSKILIAANNAFSALQTQGINKSFHGGLNFSTEHGVRPVEWCGCRSRYEWGEILLDGSSTCPDQPTADGRTLQYVTIGLSAVAVWIPCLLVLARGASAPGALLLFGLLLQSANWVSDGGLLQLLLVDKWCEDQTIGIVAMSLLAAAGLGNLYASLSLLNYASKLDEDGVTEFWGQNYVAIVLMSPSWLLGMEGVGILASDAGGWEVFGLLRNKTGLREKFFEQVSYFSLWQLIVHAFGQLGIQLWLLLSSGASTGLTYWLAIGLSGAAIAWGLVRQVAGIDVPTVVERRRGRGARHGPSDTGKEVGQVRGAAATRV